MPQAATPPIRVATARAASAPVAATRAPVTSCTTLSTLRRLKLANCASLDTTQTSRKVPQRASHAQMGRSARSLPTRVSHAVLASTPAQKRRHALHVPQFHTVNLPSWCADWRANQRENAHPLLIVTVGTPRIRCVQVSFTCL